MRARVDVRHAPVVYDDLRGRIESLEIVGCFNRLCGFGCSQMSARNNEYWERKKENGKRSGLPGHAGVSKTT